MLNGITVREIGDSRILLSTGDELPYGFCVWAAGNGPLPFVSNFINEVMMTGFTYELDESRKRKFLRIIRCIDARWKCKRIYKRWLEDGL